jgi:hypothetical protein
MDKKHIVLYTLAIGVMSVGGWLAAGPLPGARASGSCCNTSEDCTLSGYLCYKPSGGLADCSPTKPNYCFQQQPN